MHTVPDKTCLVEYILNHHLPVETGWWVGIFIDETLNLEKISR